MAPPPLNFGEAAAISRIRSDIADTHLEAMLLYITC